MRRWFDKKRVCIVGGAQSLFDKTLGEEIDSYDVVCRLNGGAEIVKPESQGLRNDIWGIGKWQTVSHLFDKCKWGNAIHLSPNPLSEKHNVYDYIIIPDTYKNMGQLYMDNTNDDISMTYIGNRVKIPYKILKASTGLIMTYYASINNPKSITLYGFDWKRTPTWYFGLEEYNRKHQPHDWEWEEWFIKELLDVNIVE